MLNKKNTNLLLKVPNERAKISFLKTNFVKTKIPLLKSKVHLKNAKQGGSVFVISVFIFMSVILSARKYNEQMEMMRAMMQDEPDMGRDLRR